MHSSKGTKPTIVFKLYRRLINTLTISAELLPLQIHEFKIKYIIVGVILLLHTFGYEMSPLA